jgi:hypothetical protein
MTDRQLYNCMQNVVRIGILTTILSSWFFMYQAPEVAPVIMLFGVIGIAPLAWLSYVIKRDMPPRKDY